MTEVGPSGMLGELHSTAGRVWAWTLRDAEQFVAEGLDASLVLASKIERPGRNLSWDRTETCV